MERDKNNSSLFSPLSCIFRIVLHLLVVVVELSEGCLGARRTLVTRGWPGTESGQEVRRYSNLIPSALRILHPSWRMTCGAHGLLYFALQLLGLAHVRKLQLRKVAIHWDIAKQLETSPPRSSTCGITNENNVEMREPSTPGELHICRSRLAWGRQAEPTGYTSGRCCAK